MVNRVQSKIGFKNMTTQQGTLGALFLTAISESPLSQVVWCNVVPEEAEVASEFVGEAFSSSGPPRGQRGTGSLKSKLTSQPTFLEKIILRAPSYLVMPSAAYPTPLASD